MKRLILAASAALLLLAAISRAQERGEVIDRVIAVVEDRAILASDLEIEYRQYLFQSQIKTLPPDQEVQLRTQLIDQLVADQLLAVHAEKTGVMVPDDAVEDELNKALEDSRRNAGGDENFERELERAGLTLQQLRSQWKEKIRSRYLVEQLLRGEVWKDVTITDAEVRKYYREHKDELPKRPPTMKLAHIDIKPGVDPERSSEALEKLKKVEAEIKAGKDFAEAAEEYSEGPSARYGGSLGYVNLTEFGETSPEFEAAARKLITGEVSPPVLTHFGWHLIKLEDVSGEEVKVRHILIKVDQGDEQIADAAARAEAVRQEILDGLDFGEAAAKYSADVRTRENGGVEEEELNLERLVGQADWLLEILRETDVGHITPVIKEEKGFRIIKVLQKNPSRAWTYQEARGELENMIGQQKRMEKFQEYVHELKGMYYVDIKGGGESEVELTPPGS